MEAQAATTGITLRYRELGGERSWLGRALGPEVCGLRDGGCFQQFTGGSLYWSKSTGVRYVRGAIRDRWGSSSWEKGPLGYPTSDEFCGLKGGGCAQRFVGGLIYWTPNTGANPVRGAIGGSYAAVGWENSALGYPTGSEFCGLKNSGCAQRFTGGLIYFSPKTGSHPVWGAISGAYAAQRWENGPLGYPTGSEFCGLKGGGCAQRFTGGMAYWSGPSGAHTVWGALLSHYASQGYERGALGYPTSSESISGSIATQSFQGGRLNFDFRTGVVSKPGSTNVGTVSGSYPDIDAVQCGPKSWCKNGSGWSPRGFAWRQCTDFAAWRRGMVWNEIAGNGDGNARGWKQGWINRGRTVSNVPKVGSIAWWGPSKGGGYGHVAIVLAVNPNGTVKVEHYNYEKPGGYTITNNMRAEAYLY